MAGTSEYIGFATARVVEWSSVAALKSLLSESVVQRVHAGLTTDGPRFESSLSHQVLFIQYQMIIHSVK